MPPKAKLLLACILGLYAFLYVATSYQAPCDGDCAVVEEVAIKLRKNRETYVYGAYRCGFNRGTDTLCVYVKDTSGINWSLIADSTCFFANQVGLAQQKIFVLKSVPGLGIDTLARKNCP
jgi:hypothetical protein